MYNITDIRHVHLEISSRCNANCPLCPRNFYGYPHNDGYIEHDMTLAEVQAIFEPGFIRQLNEIFINGNFGDAVMNPETVEIVQWFKQVSPNTQIRISTNGGARNADFWRDLAGTGAVIWFCIDGLEDTHSLYRQNTVFDTVIKNAQTFIQANGHAVWKMIKFDHNQHQIDSCAQLSIDLGFEKFIIVDHGRNQGPVYNKKGELVHIMGEPKIVNFNQLYRSRTTDEVLLEDITSGRSPCQIDCEVKKEKSVYISAIGEVYPCCYLGFNPRTYGHGNYHQAANQQIRAIIGENNALVNGLAKSMQWFKRVDQSWDIPTFENGRLIICNDVCGQKK